MSAFNRKGVNLLWSNNLWMFGEGMLGPLFAVFAERVGGDILDIAYAMATFLILTGVLRMVFGRISDRSIKLKKHMLVAGTFLNAVFTFSYLLVSTPAHLFAVQAGLALAAALAVPTWDALYDRYSDKQHGGYIWGMMEGWMNIATGIGMILGGLIVSTYSFTALFVVMGSVQLLAAVYQSLILRMR